MTPERKRALRRIAGTSGFGLLVFVVAFYLSFPFDRVKDQLIAQADAQNLDLEIASAGPAFGIGIAFADVTIKTRPPGGAKPLRIPIDSASMTLSPLAQLKGEMAYSVSVNAFGGDVDVDWRGSKAKGEVHVRAQDVSMTSLPGVKEAINLPLGGTLELTLDLTTPNNRAAEATGSLSWKCAACVIGDGKEKLKIAGNPMLSEGLSLPKIRLGDFVGRVAIEKGLGKLTGVQAKSPDGEILVEGEVRLADPLASSYLNLYLRFRPTDALLKGASSLQAMLQLAESTAKRPDGYFGFQMSGTFNRLSTFQPSKTSPFATSGPSSAGRPGFGRTGSQPTRAGVPAPANLAPGQVDPRREPGANTAKFATDPPSGESTVPE